MAANGVAVDVHQIREVRPKELPSPTCTGSARRVLGKPIGSMRRFLKKVDLPAGTKYAILTTEAAPHPDAAGHVPSEQEMAEWQHVRPVMNEILQGKGLIEVAEGKVSVTEIKGPLEEGWQHKVAAFAARIPIQG